MHACTHPGAYARSQHASRVFTEQEREMFRSKELGRLLPQYDQRGQTEHHEQRHQYQPVHPFLQFVHLDGRQDTPAAVYAVPGAVAEFGGQSQSDRVGERTEVLGPPQPARYEVRRHEESGEQHLWNEQYGQKFRRHLGIFHRAPQHGRQRRTSHGQCEEETVEISETHLYAHQVVLDGDGDEHLRKRNEELGRQSGDEVRHHRVVIGAVFAQKDGPLLGEGEERGHGRAEHGQHEYHDHGPEMSLKVHEILRIPPSRVQEDNPDQDGHEQRKRVSRHQRLLVPLQILHLPAELHRYLRPERHVTIVVLRLARAAVRYAEGDPQRVTSAPLRGDGGFGPYYLVGGVESRGVQFAFGYHLGDVHDPIGRVVIPRHGKSSIREEFVHVVHLPLIHDPAAIQQNDAIETAEHVRARLMNGE
mmetsp:Transcript_33938/g.101273  ORF Transcript_33938/g.101273 Transcript_33938/m.101273 type:complete len:418 (-) Transcript_33938:130-1383(-)